MKAVQLAKRLGIWLLFGSPLTNGCVGAPPQPPGQDETATTNDGDMGTTVVATSDTTSGLDSSSGGGNGSSGTADGGSTSTAVTTDPGTITTDGGSSGTTDTGSSGEPPGASYAPCMEDARCLEPFELCWPPFAFGVPNYCTLECVDAGDCPAPTSGAAAPVCEGPPGTDICALDCGRGECPDGMDCIDVFGSGSFLRCRWP